MSKRGLVMALIFLSSLAQGGQCLGLVRTKNKNKYDERNQNPRKDQKKWESHFDGVFDEPRPFSKSLLEVLGLREPPRSEDELKSARRKAIRKWHPDQFRVGTQKYQRAVIACQNINDAFDRLYDQYINKNSDDSSNEQAWSVNDFNSTIEILQRVDSPDDFIFHVASYFRTNPDFSSYELTSFLEFFRRRFSQPQINPMFLMLIGPAALQKFALFQRVQAVSLPANFIRAIVAELERQSEWDTSRISVKNLAHLRSALIEVTKAQQQWLFSMLF